MGAACQRAESIYFFRLLFYSSYRFLPKICSQRNATLNSSVTRAYLTNGDISPLRPCSLWTANFVLLVAQQLKKIELEGRRQSASKGRKRLRSCHKIATTGKTNTLFAVFSLPFTFFFSLAFLNHHPLHINVPNPHH